MLYAGLALLGLVLLAGGAFYARKEYYASKPAPIWVPLPLRPDISMADQEKLAKEIEERLRDEGLLRQVATDVDLQGKLNLPDIEAAVKELDKRLFVKVGTAMAPTGTVPSINIGLNGNGHEREIISETTTRITKDVWRMLGVDPETGLPIQRPGAASPPTPGEEPASDPEDPDTN